MPELSNREFVEWFALPGSDRTCRDWSRMDTLACIGSGTSAAMLSRVATLRLDLAERTRERDEAIAKWVSLEKKLNTPELHDFSAAVTLEAAHQRERWGSEHDAGKEPADWFWLLGYLSGKALRAHMSGDLEKALHHTISSAAALANWHAAIEGKTNMRPGIKPDEALDDLAGRMEGKK